MGRRKRPDSMILDELKEGQMWSYRMLKRKLKDYVNNPDVEFDNQIQNMMMTINNTTNSFSGLMKNIYLAEDVTELERLVNSIPPEVIAKYTRHPDIIDPGVLVPDPLA